MEFSFFLQPLQGSPQCWFVTVPIKAMKKLMGFQQASPAGIHQLTWLHSKEREHFGAAAGPALERHKLVPAVFVTSPQPW